MFSARGTASDRLPERGACSVSQTRIGCRLRRLTRKHPALPLLVTARRCKALGGVSQIRPADKRCTFRSVSRFSLGRRMSVRRLKLKEYPLRSRRFGLVVLAVLACLAACGGGNLPSAGDSPSAVLGTADPILGGGTVRSISATFGAADLHALYTRLNSAAFQSQLVRFSCGEAVPVLAFTVSIWERAEYQERHILIQSRPTFDAGGRERCLSFGLGYLLDLEVQRIDRGEPINYHYRNPMTGKELAPEPLAVPRAPACDCSKRDGKEEWVTWPDPSSSK